MDVKNYEAIELGCGSEKPASFLGVDKYDTAEADVVHDLDDFPWPFPDNTFKTVRAIDVFEHVKKPVKFMEEIHRISRKNAKVIIQSPHQSSQNWTDMTHKRLVGWRTFSLHFTSSGKWSSSRTNAKFKEEQKHFTFRPYPFNFIGKWFAGWKPLLYEQSPMSRLFPACNLIFELRVVKGSRNQKYSSDDV